jgi:hypothetical protein
LLVAAVSGELEQNMATYHAVSAAIQAIYGDVPNYHPLKAGKLRLALDFKTLSQELRVRTEGGGRWQRVGYLFRMLFQNLAGKFIFARNIDTETTQWSHYRDDLVDNTDFRKFDGMLRMVIDGNDAQAAALEDFLAAEQRAGRLVYGLHKSQAALITCLVRSHNGDHLHFVDGSDGGYALAAKRLKQQLVLLKSA